MKFILHTTFLSYILLYFHHSSLLSHSRLFLFVKRLSSITLPPFSLSPFSLCFVFSLSFSFFFNRFYLLPLLSHSLPFSLHYFFLFPFHCFFTISLSPSLIYIYFPLSIPSHYLLCLSLRLSLRPYFFLLYFPPTFILLSIPSLSSPFFH